MRAVYKITLPGLHAKTGAQLYVYFECTYTTLDLLVSDLNDGMVIIGASLWTKRGSEPGVLEIVDRLPYAIAAAGVARIEIPEKVCFVQYEEDAA